MRTPSFHATLPGAVVALALCSATALAQNQPPAFAGTVADQTHTPLTGVVVTLSSGDRVLQTQTSARGQFRFESVSPGLYNLECSALGFYRQHMTVDLSRGDAPPLSIILRVGIVPDSETCGPHPSTFYSPFDLKSPQLAGVIRNYVDGKPVVHARLVLTPADHPRLRVRALADEGGRFRFENLAAGRYDLRVSRHGYFPAELKELLVPKENRVTVDVPMKRDDGKLIFCQ